MSKTTFKKDILGLTQEVNDRTDGNIPTDEITDEVAIIATKKQQQQMMATFKYFTELSKEKEQASSEAVDLWSGLLEVVAQAVDAEPDVEGGLESQALDLKGL